MILEINREMISRYGGTYTGTDNLSNSASLDWVLDAIRYPIYFTDLYPTLVQKTAILAWTINEGHVFVDGNKRTSNMSAMIFLMANGFMINASQDELFEISELIATCKASGFTIEEYVNWINERLRKIE